MIRALLVVEVPFYREGLAELLNKSDDVRVVGSASAVAAAESLVEAEQPDVVLIDVTLADAHAAIQRMRLLPSRPKFVAIAMHDTPNAVLQWAELGISGYVPRSATLEELLRAIRGVGQQEFYCSPRMAAHLMNHVATLASATRREDPVLGELSPREHEVVSLLARGLPNKAIANKLAISHATAKNHVHKILEKLRLRRRSEVASLVHSQAQRTAA